MQISYHSVLIKIQKLQNLKKKKKKKLFSLPAGIAQNWPVRPVFFLVLNRGVECTGLLAGTVYSGRIGRYGTELITLCKSNVIPNISAYLDKFWKMLNDCVLSITQNKYHTYKTNGYSNIGQFFQIIYYEENYIPHDPPLSLSLSLHWIYFTIFFKNEVKQCYWVTNLVLSILRNFNQSQTKLL